MTDISSPPASPLHALSVYAEPLLEGRSVVVFGDGTRGLGERFLELGARSVRLYDPQPSRVASARLGLVRGLSVEALPTGDIDVRDGAFDVAIVADLSENPSPASLIARLRRLLAPGGVALVRSRSAHAGGSGARQAEGALDYYELYDIVAMQFAHVRMVGQIPWSGVLLAELGREDDEPDVTVDTQLMMDDVPPDAFVAVCSQDEVRLAEYALVQLPSAPAVDVLGAIAYGSERADLAAAQLRASLLDAQVEELRANKNIEGVAHADAIATLEAELADRLTELTRLEARLVDAQARGERAVAELRTRDEEFARLRDLATLAANEVVVERSERQRLEGEVVQSERRLGDAATELRAALSIASGVPALEGEILRLAAALEAVPEPAREDDGDDLPALEAALRERGDVVRGLEEEVRRRERIARDLIHALEEARSGGASDAPAPMADEVGALLGERDALRLRVDAAALEAARREGEFATLSWRIQELEQEVQRLDEEKSEATMTIPPPAFLNLEREANDVTALAARLASAEDQLDVLRQALAQEHEAKKRLESGEALTEARTELARQAALLEKLSRELEMRDGVREVGAG